MADTINIVIDLSHHNGNVNLVEAAADGIVGVIHKATQGATFNDPAYATNKQKASDAGLLWGAYHFGDGSDPILQADHFLNVVQPDDQTLIVLDFEENTAGASMTLDGARAFVNRINEKTGRFPGLYGGSFLKHLLGANTDPVLANCWLWIAQFTLTPAPTVPKNWPSWTMWQYTDGKSGAAPHQVQGVGLCDRDQFNGDLAALQALWGVAADSSDAENTDDTGNAAGAA
jgi:lysozyme